MNTQYADQQPKYVKNVLSGYDASGDVPYWRFSDGRRGTKHRVLEQRSKEDFSHRTDWGYSVNMRQLTPISNALESMQNIMAGVDLSSLDKLANTRSPDPMPADILAMMQLCDLYARTEGDVFQLIEAPMDLCLRPVDIDCPDKGFEKALAEVYNATIGVDIDEQIYQIWLASSIYGQAFPLEIWDDNKELQWIVHLNPMSVKVGIGTGGFSYGLTNNGGRWTEEAIESQIPPMAYKSFLRDPNDAVLAGDDIKIKREYCFSVREKSLKFHRYAIPPMARAFRAISTRRIMEEMLRATMEGYRNQLWLFLVGDQDHVPSVAHINALKSAVDGMAGERTGALVWYNAPLEVKTIAPATFDQMSGTDTWMVLTQHIYRQLGVHLRVVSGESSAAGMGGGDGELDVRILLERTKFKRNQVIKWEQHLRYNIAKYMLGGSKAAMKAAGETTVSFSRSPLEIESEVKEVLMPVYSAGALSTTTLLRRIGENYQAELARKQDEEPNAELFGPKPTYAQQTVNPDTEETQTDNAPKGRTPDAQNKKQMLKARFDDDPKFAELLNTVYNSFDELVAGNVTSDDFIKALTDTIETYAKEFALDGYHDAGGAGYGPPDTWVRGSHVFVNSFVSGLKDALDSTDNPESLRWRVYLYPQEIRNLAYMYGVQWAMRERGARGWRRVLHPELSEDGPCMDCIRDSSIIHSIDEPFFEFHPNGVCSEQGVAYYTDYAEPFTEIPVPSKVTLPERIKEIIERLGKIGQAFIRRIRP